ncbi:hypothetical protein [Propionivibrio soli]|uniref:hypothetical protein n=1 Tax=Propionivibrio soli TaxID=2976531 RepID=UPI0021E988AC|nr:hypothetical protein [Propionivibrio soli]
MLNEIPKLFGKNFVVGFLLPGFAFCLAATLTTNVLHLTLPGWDSITKDLATLGGMAALFSWLVGTILVAFNRFIYRLFEGYIGIASWSVLKRIETYRFEATHTAVKALAEAYERQGEQFTDEQQRTWSALNLKLAEQFPDSERFLLPTSLGNRIRAFEVYPRVMYGLDGIPGWSRLVCILPKDYAEVIETAKTGADLWLNLSVLSLLLADAAALLCAYHGYVREVWLPTSGLLLSILFYYFALGATSEWGQTVKAAFDVFLPALSEKLGYETEPLVGDEARRWAGISEAIIYRDPSRLSSPRGKKQVKKTYRLKPPCGCCRFGS